MQIIKVKKDDELADLLQSWYETFENNPDMQVQATIFGTMHMIFAMGASTNTRDLQLLKNNVTIRRDTFIEYPRTKSDDMPDPSPEAAAYMQQVTSEANRILKLLENQGL